MMLQRVKETGFMRTLKGKVTMAALSAMIVVSGVMAFSSYLGNKRLLSDMEQNAITNDRIMFRTLLDKHFQWLSHRLSLVLRVDEITSAFQSRDRERLEISAVQALDLMKSQGNFSKLTFYVDPGTAFFRAHAPEKYGDNVTRTRKLVEKAFLEKKEFLEIDLTDLLDMEVRPAEETGISQLEVSEAIQTFMGVEVEPDGANLFLVQPLYRYGELLGMVEAGGDFQPILNELKDVLGSDVSLLLKKGIDLSGPELITAGDMTVLGTTDKGLLRRMANAVDLSASLKGEQRVTHQDGSRTLATTFIPLKDFSHKTIGVAAITSDITSFMATISQSLSRAAVIALLGFTLTAGLIFLILHRSFRPLSEMIDILKDLAEGEGDLTRRIDVHSHGEIKELADWMNTFIRNIQTIISRIKETMKTVSSSSKQIALSTDEVSSGATEQSSAIREIAASMEAIEQMNLEIVDNVSNLSLHTDEASSSIMEMSASLDEVAVNAKHSSSAVEETSSSIVEIGASINEISTSIDALSSSASQTAASIEAIDRSIQEVEKNAKNSLQFSEESVAKAEEGMVAVTQTQEGMDTIKETFEESSRVIKRLGERSVEIGKMLEIIDEVAEQTNLLALNAAIIAAQAGEYGKGFAVVADEIKSLAKQSAFSSSEIAEVIRSVQQESDAAIQSMEVSSSSISKGAELSAQAKEALQEIVQSVNRSQRTVKEIAQAAVEQSKGSRMVKKAVTNITDSLHEIVKGTQEQRIGSKQIIKNIEELDTMSSHAGRAMEEQVKGSTQITTVIEEINKKTQGISRSTEGQAQKSKEVLSNSKKIEQISSKNTLQVQEMTKAISEMAEKVERLQCEIDRFQI